MTSLGQAESCDWGMVGLPGDKDAVCAAPKPRAGQAQPDVCLPLEPPAAQAGPSPPTSLPGVARPKQADREGTLESQGL